MGAGGGEPRARETSGSRYTIKADGWASVGSTADDIARVLDQRGPKPVGVAGWSAGGRVAAGQRRLRLRA